MSPPVAGELPGSRWRTILRVISTALFIAYPVAVWFGLQAKEPRSLALLLLLIMVPVLILGYRGTREEVRRFALLPGCTIGALLAAALVNDAGFVLAAPSIVNGALLFSFGVTLRSGAMPMIERFARLQEPDLTPDKQAWCRGWTWIWCGFFVLNGSVAALLAVVDLWWWTFYASVLSYILIGVLLLTEWLLRRRRFAAA